MIRRFEEKVVLVTGSGQGIGRGCALRFAGEGAHVIITDINSETAEKVASEAREAGGKGFVVLADVRMPDQVQSMVSKVLDEFGRIDILVNNVGGRAIVKAVAGHVIELDEKRDWDPVFEVCLKTTFLCSKYVGREMVRRGYGKIINISSMAGKDFAVKKLLAYSAAKAGVIRITQILALELAPYGINVNAVCPGFVQTPLLDKVWQNRAEAEGISFEEVRQRDLDTIPLGRIGQPEDIGAVVAFLASEDASYMTGQAINVTGGILMH